MLLDIEEELKRMVADAPEGEFCPFAYYDESLDTIFVFTEDCSYSEIGSGGMYIFKKNHIDEKAQTHYAGFSI